MGLRPLRNRVHVERLPDIGRTRDAHGFEVTAGGIAVPQDYKAIGSRKAVNKADQFRARVLAVGSEVKDDLVQPGVEVLLYTWSGEEDGTRRSMYTGSDGPGATLFVKYPDDFAGVVLEPKCEAAE